MNSTVLDILLSSCPVTCKSLPVTVNPDDLVHVVGAQEPVREQSDSRSRTLLELGWLKIESIRTNLSHTERARVVSALQDVARAWLKQNVTTSRSEDQQQVRWLLERTRTHESKQMIVQRVWLAIVLYSQGCRGFFFDQEGQVIYDGGIAGRIGLAPDDVIDLAWQQSAHQIYTASFRHPDGTILRGKGRHRWNIYRLTLDPVAKFLFDRRAKSQTESIALIVASETHATQPQLPRDFYGGNAFQQACIDAQDQQFAHILVLSPQHGVISLDDMVPSEQHWDNVLEQHIWSWPLMSAQRLGAYLFGDPGSAAPETSAINWWVWLNPNSSYRFTVFGSGFAVRILFDYLFHARVLDPFNYPEIMLADQRPGYDIGEVEDEFSPAGRPPKQSPPQSELDHTLQEFNQFLEWATEFVALVNIIVPPTGEVWTLAPDEALIPVRLLAEAGIDLEDLLDLLTDINILLEKSLPFSLLVNAPTAVSIMLQITHNLVHDERGAIQEPLDIFPDDTLRQYVEHTLQETTQEDRLCACLTLTEQLHMLALLIPSPVGSELLVWLQTYLSARIRQRLLNGEQDPQ